MKRCITKSMEQNRAHKKDPQIRTHTYLQRWQGTDQQRREIHSEKIKLHSTYTYQAQVEYKPKYKGGNYKVYDKYMIYEMDPMGNKIFSNKTLKSITLKKACYTALKLSFQNVPVKGLKTNHSV